MQKLKIFFSDFYNSYLTLLGALVSLAFLAPISLALGLTPVAKVLYFIYSFFCHQFANRSIHLFDYQLAWCARDTGIWIGFFVVALLIKMQKVKGIKWYWVILFVIPIALDGGIQTVFTMLNVNAAGSLVGDPGYISNNLLRFMTGSIFGIGVSLWLSPLMQTKNAAIQELKSVKLKFHQKNFFKILVLMIAMFPTFLLLLGVWDITSQTNNPVAPIESVAKVNKDQFFYRREDAICPVNALDDFLDLDCFLKLN